MNTPDIVAALAPIIDVFDELSVSYSVVGSVASSAHGVARATLDADLVADLKTEHVDALVDALIDDYYVDRDAAMDAVRRRAMFNLVHLQTMLKVDVYVLTGRPFDRESFRRRQEAPLEDAEGARRYAVDTPEDTVLHKLEWYRAGGEVSDRQWSDILGVLKVQSGDLDFAYTRRWAADLGVEDLLDRAIEQAEAS